MDTKGTISFLVVWAILFVGKLHAIDCYFCYYLEGEPTTQNCFNAPFKEHIKPVKDTCTRGIDCQELRTQSIKMVIDSAPGVHGIRELKTTPKFDARLEANESSIHCVSLIGEYRITSDTRRQRTIVLRFGFPLDFPTYNACDDGAGMQDIFSGVTVKGGCGCRKNECNTQQFGPTGKVNGAIGQIKGGAVVVLPIFLAIRQM